MKDDGIDKIIQFFKKRLLSKRGFSLIELLITLAIFGILMATVMQIVLINLRVAALVKGRSYAREETSFMLKILKKDIRNAEAISPDSGDNLSAVIVTGLDAQGDVHSYRWSQNEQGQVQRVEVAPSSGVISYKTPADVVFDRNEPLSFSINCEENNCVVKIRMKAWSRGMPGDPEDPDDPAQWITKEVAVSTRNFNL